MILFLISLFSLFLLSPGPVCFSQVHAGSSSSLSFFPLGSSDVNGKCKHSDELPGKKEATSGAYLNFSKLFQQSSLYLCEVINRRFHRALRYAFPLVFRGPKGGLSYPAGSVPRAMTKAAAKQGQVLTICSSSKCWR